MFNLENEKEKEIYLNYCVVNIGGDEYLGYATDGYFASTAWKKGDDEYSQIIGRKFGCITSNDSTDGWIDKSNVRRLEDMDEYNRLLDFADPFFRSAILLEQTKIGTDITKSYLISLIQDNNTVSFKVKYGCRYLFAMKNNKDSVYADFETDATFMDVALIINDVDFDSNSEIENDYFRAALMQELLDNNTVEVPVTKK